MALALAGFCFSVIFIVFVCTRLACALLRRRRARSRRATALPQFAVAHYSFADHAARLSAGAGVGLDPAAVAAFPTRAFAAAAAGAASDSDDADSQCVICLAEYKENDVLRILPYCSHNFHIARIDLWLEQNTTCPICRVSLLDIPDSEQTAPPPLPSVVISCPSSPESSRSDLCRCLFVSTGHSSGAPEAPRHEPDQENQVASAPSMDGANNMALSEVNPPPENKQPNSKKAGGQIYPARALQIAAALASLLSLFCRELRGEVPVKCETSALVDGCCRFSFEGFAVNMRNHSGFLLKEEKKESPFFCQPYSKHLTASKFFSHFVVALAHREMIATEAILFL